MVQTDCLLIVMQDSPNSDKGKPKLVDIILPLEQSEDQDAWQKAISKKLEIMRTIYMNYVLKSIRLMLGNAKLKYNYE